MYSVGHNLLLLFGCSGARTDIFLVRTPIIYLTPCLFFSITWLVYLLSLHFPQNCWLLCWRLDCWNLLQSFLSWWCGRIQGCGWGITVWIVEGKNYTCLVQSRPLAQALLLFFQNFLLAVLAQSWGKKKINKKKEKTEFSRILPWWDHPDPRWKSGSVREQFHV